MAKNKSLDVETVNKNGKKNTVLTNEELSKLSSKDGLIELLKSKHINVEKALRNLQYEEELKALQGELVKLQNYITRKKMRVAILFEGRDAAGKGGTIRRFVEHLNPRSMRIVALPRPTDLERGQWYFQRYTQQLPNRGEIVFFDRSWYNRAVVEPVNDFCTEAEYERFMKQVPEFEHMLYEAGVIIIKFWFSISKDEQIQRFESRKTNLLKQWKLSPVDGKAQELWDKYTHYKNEMFSKTHTEYCPWIIVKANNKKIARLETMKYVLSQIKYSKEKNSDKLMIINPNIVSRYYRKIVTLD